MKKPYILNPYSCEFGIHRWQEVFYEKLPGYQNLDTVESDEGSCLMAALDVDIYVPLQLYYGACQGTSNMISL